MEYLYVSKTIGTGLSLADPKRPAWVDVPGKGVTQQLSGIIDSDKHGLWVGTVDVTPGGHQAIIGSVDCKYLAPAIYAKTFAQLSVGELAEVNAVMAFAGLPAGIFSGSATVLEVFYSIAGRGAYPAIRYAVDYVSNPPAAFAISAVSQMSAVGAFTGPPPAFFGFGAAASGGTVPYTVTSLANSGPGTLRDALSVSGRLISFSVGGTISLLTNVYALSNTTIDGSTAPSPGITITNTLGDGLRIHGNSAGPNTVGSNIIVKYLRFRGCAGDGVQIAYNAHDIVIDHVSSANNTDGDIDVTNGAYNVTISNCLMKNKTGASPGCSLLSYNAGLVTHYRNIYYGANDRNPIITHTNLYSEVGPSGPPHGAPMADVRYNIVWDYGIGTYIMNGGAGGNVNANIVSNLYSYKTGGTPGNVIARSRFSGGATRADGYIAGNVSAKDCRGNCYMYGIEPNVTRLTCNDQSNIPEVLAPALIGPSVTDKQGRLDIWTEVKNTAGVINFFPDDVDDAAVRAAITIPTIAVFNQPWNDG